MLNNIALNKITLIILISFPKANKGMRFATHTLVNFFYYNINSRIISSVRLERNQALQEPYPLQAQHTIMDLVRSLLFILWVRFLNFASLIEPIKIRFV